MPGAAGLGEAVPEVGGLGFSHSPGGSRKRLPYPSILTKVLECSYSAGPLICLAQGVGFGTNYPFFSHQGRQPVLGTTKRIRARGPRGVKGPLWVDRPCLRRHETSDFPLYQL